jgi:hypothetical protein
MLLRKFKTFLLRLGAKRALRDARSSSVRALAANGGPAARVLVVCHGNIYRSPLVAVRMRELLGPQRGIRSPYATPHLRHRCGVSPPGRTRYAEIWRSCARANPDAPQ